jgi:hypothetical protein
MDRITCGNVMFQEVFVSTDSVSIRVSVSVYAWNFLTHSCIRGSTTLISFVTSSQLPLYLEIPWHCLLLVKESFVVCARAVVDYLPAIEYWEDLLG